MNVSENLITVLVFSGLLTVPSVVFAEANWYGSLRGGVTMGGGEDAKFTDYGSRWGIRGSNEVSEGLSANYRFEHKISTANASQPGGRLAYVGLSGGFGTISLGQIWSASYNAIGGLSDPAWVNSNTQTSYRNGNSLSYAVSAGSLSLQVDAIMNGGTDTGGAVDQLEFGLTFNVTDNISLAVAHTSNKDDVDTTADEVRPAIEEVTDAQGVVTTPGQTALMGLLKNEERKANHFAVQMSLGGLSAYVTHSQSEVDWYATPTSSMVVSEESKVTRYGVSGGIGDGGLSFYVMARSEDVFDTDIDEDNPYGERLPKANPWLAGITKSLGSGASAFAEYHDPDDGSSGTSHLGLVVNF